MNTIELVTPTPYSDLNDVLDILIGNVREILGANFLGAYLQGSFAVGDFDEHSDVDFIMVTKAPISADHVQALQIMHDSIYQLECPWAQHLEGSYFPKEVLRTHAQRGTELWYLEHGARTLIESDHCNTIVVRWSVREFGVTLAGPAPRMLIDPISVDDLRAEIKGVIDIWGQEILDNPEKFNNYFYQTFIVLSFCRFLHDLIRGFPGSKREGAEWAKANLDLAWSGLIDRTWAGRPDPATKVRQPADPNEFRLTLEFVRYIREQSERFCSLSSS